MLLAQTNLQLLTQIREAGYTIADLQEVSAAYWLAAEAFSGKVRGSGKPFLCHLVGTAAATVLERPPVHVICAALCHGIFENGDFGEFTPAVRTGLVSERLGSDAVALLGRYSAMQKHRATRLAMLLDKAVDEVPQDERWSALIWVANEADDEIDGGSRFRTDRPDRDQRKELSVALARHFQWDKLTGLLMAAYRSYDLADWAQPLASPHTTSVTIARRAPRPEPNTMKRLYWSLYGRLKSTRNGR